MWRWAEIWRSLWRVSNCVDAYRTAVYVGLFLWAVQNVIWPDPMAVSIMVPHPIYVVWMAMHVAAPLIICAGLCLSWETLPPGWIHKQILRGWELQLVGDLAVFFIAAATSYAFFESDELSGNFTAPSYAGAAAIVAWWALRDAMAVCRHWDGVRAPAPDRLDDVD